MSGVKRVFVEKKKPFAVNAKELLEEIGGYLGIKTRIFQKKHIRKHLLLFFLSHR